MSWSRTVFIISIITVISVIPFINGQGCTVIDKCSCSMDDGSGIITLDSISNNDGTAAFADLKASDDYAYSYNPCYPFSEGMCFNVAACQETSDRTYGTSIGDPDTAILSYDGLNVHIKYTGTEGRQTDVVLVCDKNTEASMVANGENPTLTYTFTLNTKCACPGTCSLGGSSSGLSAGSVLCIMFICIMAAYLLVGVAFQKIKNGATGKEVIPNVIFWSTLPGLIKDGFLLIFSKCRRGSYQSM